MLLVSATVYADGILSGPIMRTISGTAACATSDTSLPHDTLLEGFQTATTGYENTWTETGTTANITEAADSTALTTGKPTGACNQAWKVVFPADGTETYAQWDRGSVIDVAVTAINVVFYLLVESPMDAGETSLILSGSETTNPSASQCFEVALGRTGSNTEVWAIGATAASKTVITTGAWHKIDVHIDTTAANSTISVDEAAPNSFTRSSTWDVRYMNIGGVRGIDVNDNATIWFDVICVNTP